MVFALFASTGFLLIVIVSRCSPATPSPSEASWSSLRYLLAAPVPRERLLRQKLVVALGFSVVALVFLPAWTPARRRDRVRLGAYIGAARRPASARARAWCGSGSSSPTCGRRCSSCRPLAFVLGVWTDAPLGRRRRRRTADDRVAILDSITALGGWRQGLPGHYAYAWADVLGPTIVWDQVARGALWSLGYALVFFVARLAALPAQGRRELTRGPRP